MLTGRQIHERIERRNAPLNVTTGPDGEMLTISIGINVLAFAAEHDTAGLRIKVKNKRRWARDVENALLHEKEDGETAIGKVLDAAFRYAAENGSDAIEHLPPPIDYRRAEPRDVPSLDGLQHACWSPEWVDEATRIRTYVTRGIVIVALDGDQIIGACYGLPQRRELLLYCVEVDPRYRRRLVALNMMRKIMSVARGKELKTVRSWVVSPGGAALMERFGLRRTGRVRIIHHERVPEFSGPIPTGRPGSGSKRGARRSRGPAQRGR